MALLNSAVHDFYSVCALFSSLALFNCAALRDMTVLLGEDATLEFREIAKFRIEIKK